MEKSEKINNYVEFKIKSQKNTLKGLLLSYTDEWSLLLSNPVDYVCDGYTLIRNNQIINHRMYSSTSLLTKVLQKKALQNKCPKLNMKTSKSLFESLFKEGAVISIQNINKNSFKIGKIKKIYDIEFDFELLNPKAKWLSAKKIKIKDVDIIELNTDYVNSLLLMA